MTLAHPDLPRPLEIAWREIGDRLYGRFSSDGAPLWQHVQRYGGSYSNTASSSGTLYRTYLEELPCTQLVGIIQRGQEQALQIYDKEEGLWISISQHSESAPPGTPAEYYGSEERSYMLNLEHRRCIYMLSSYEDTST